ncbi:MAG: SDR family oxidoreductase [Brevundimonas sp.]|uniref:SDR family NAD(P)-dependent oxidoreductase n=1 Tax=Brevundimonas sp. TaxID=1871086 RepID=UPI00271B88B4|nr:SDR family oxidoreductase [Brevundimonas sp.]MDO9587697.1 SDR family oxidoreductase [Brevundimonas sp.]MDP3370415.1 SDR family oxidoreductase [Brevundimonas sp.]MDP3656654.1 SDR family oxidoreductase [Brevundimonas sp.]MDZ4113182.1 SDR family oxidoreductase [Brevundimonas sp.]
MSLTGHHAVVTGAGSGIGRATAERLAEGGCQVTLIGRHVARLNETADRIGDLAFAAPADVTDPDMLAAAIEVGRDRFGPVDILINNAGAATSAPFLKTDADAFRAMLALNLEAPAEAARLVLPGMLTRRWGRIVNVASTAGLKGYAYVSAYVAAKHGLVGLTRALALEVAAKGVTVNAVCPGFTETELVARSIESIIAKTGRSEEEARAALAASNPQGRLITPDEVAQTIVWLCGDGASGINGAAVPVAGGEL